MTKKKIVGALAGIHAQAQGGLHDAHEGDQQAGILMQRTASGEERSARNWRSALRRMRRRFGKKRLRDDR